MSGKRSGLFALLILAVILAACVRSPDVPRVDVTPVPTNASEAITPDTDGIAAMPTPTLEGESAEESGTADEADPRQPEGDIEAFWNDFDWNDLRPNEQELWGVLGWDEASWQEETDPPASEEMTWEELTDEERDAAEQLGYDQATWDTTAPE
jgi:hypothetical protein